MATRAVQFLAIMLTALALVPAGAHFFELPNKIGLERDAYFAVQAVYRGWALFSFVLLPAIAVNFLLAVLLRGQGARFSLSAAASVLIAATLAIFFTCTYPANQATADWTTAPENWRDLRTRWEYAHATNAVLTFLALCCLVYAALMRDD